MRNKIHSVYAVGLKLVINRGFLKIGLLPLCYGHEFLDLVYVFKCLVSLSDPFISGMNSTRPRRIVSSKGTLLNTKYD